jgi:hypothetical protein
MQSKSKCEKYLTTPRKTVKKTITNAGKDAGKGNPY